MKINSDQVPVLYGPGEVGSNRFVRCEVCFVTVSGPHDEAGADASVQAHLAWHEACERTQEAVVTYLRIPEQWFVEVVGHGSFLTPNPSQIPRLIREHGVEPGEDINKVDVSTRYTEPVDSEEDRVAPTVR